MGLRSWPPPACASPLPRSWAGPPCATDRWRRRVPVADGSFAGRLDPGLVETELKLSATGEGPLQRLAAMRQLGSMLLGTPEPFLAVDRYPDAGVGLRRAAG